MWYNNVGRTFFRFGTIHAFDRRTAFSWLDRVACNACMQRGKNLTIADCKILNPYNLVYNLTI